MMSVNEAMASRRSIRAFLDRPVPMETLRRIVDAARFTPSGCNFQPWEATILTGEPLRTLQEKILAASPQDPIEYPIQPLGIDAEYMGRLKQMGASLYGAEGIARGDDKARRTSLDRNATSFGAPVLLLCYIPRVMGPPQWADVGMWLQSLMLLLREQGLDSCPQEYMALYGRLVKEHIGIDDDRYILFCGLAIGYRDADAPVNNFERPSVSLEQHVRFVGF